MGYKIAIIPWSENCLQDRLFDVDNEEVNFDHRLDPYLDMKKYFEGNGDELRTIDMYTDLREVNLFLFFDIDWSWMWKIIKLGYESKMVYCNAEPPVVYMRNTLKGYKWIKRFFPYIMTWNEDWIDNETIFKRPIPYYFQLNFGDIGFNDKKLLTCISGNKESNHPDELYSERRKVINFFEKSYPNDFDFYGTGWKRENHTRYCGKADKKSETYHHYKFALCFENMKNVRGYITEKIFDCLTSGIVPIYAGAIDVERYIPKECYIDYWQFKDLDELADYLTSMPYSVYEKYLEAANIFLNSERRNCFRGDEYAKDIYVVLNKDKTFKVRPWNRWYVNLLVSKNKFLKGLKRKLKVRNC